ncbi:MAG: hypothetical protein OJF59_000960 [Cytophagales bacterium]|mgnify:CR=1 FL=1|jgi:uncharacterized membrane protein|nr:DUF4870 domain-containing protein [Bacteroidota bacterium]MBS1980043.1 DUF4870 domain-containing protein [Bacteroidota bacterium]WHZ07207.1 MAG: hypothetical protein OJF59_000960 [Cytophagales bacterium]
MSLAIDKFGHEPSEHEAENASNSYLMSLVAVVAGLPLPIMNLVATLFFYIGNRKGSHFVRWHCTQALLSQASLLPVNSIGFWWTISIIFSNEQISSKYIAYLITIVLFNLFDFIATMIAAVQTRKGIHVEWWLYGSVTNLICRA